jgi:hypothetical protein
MITPGSGASSFISTPWPNQTFYGPTWPPIGETFLLVVSILSPTATVTAISDNDLNSYSKIAGYANTAGGFSVEIWKATVTATASWTAILVQISAFCLFSVALQTYDGVSSIGNISAQSSGNGAVLHAPVIQLQDGGNFAVGLIACISASSTYFAGTDGSTLRQAAIGVFAGAGCGIIDRQSRTVAKVQSIASLTIAQYWTMFAVELRTGVKLYESQAQFID